MALDMAVTMPQQFLGGVPIVEFDSFQATAVNPKVIGLFLNFSFGGFDGWFRQRVVFHGWMGDLLWDEMSKRGRALRG